MCKLYYYEDECPFYPDCASCYDPDSMDYLWREEEEEHECCGSCLSCGHSNECMIDEMTKQGND